jgi:HEAT repeat protein
LRDIHTDEAFEALADSMRQGDARARQQVVEDIGRFYRPESLELIRQILKTEKNPEILHEAICNLGRYNDEQVRQVLLDYLESQSYRERLAMGVVEAIDKLKDPYFITPLQETLSKREHEFRSWEFSRALVTLAKIASDEEDKTNVCNFLAGYVNHKKERIAAGAIQALGELGDAMAIGVVETFSGDDEGDHIQRTAKKALKKLREEKELVPDEISELREVVDELRKESQKLKDELEDLKRRLEAEQERKEAADSNVTAADQD